MGYEIDFLASGEKSSGGDAIVLRYGDLHGPRSAWTLVVIDGGYTVDGDKMVEFIRSRFKTSNVDLVVSTHPDNDHAAGLLPVLAELEVGRLWLHKPWEHVSPIQWKDGRVTDRSVGDRLKRSLNVVRDLDRLATRKGILIEEPFKKEVVFTGLTVMGPTRQYYESLLPNFRATPAAVPSLASAFDDRWGSTGLLSKVHRVKESLDVETLDNKGETSAENNSSVVLLMRVDERVVLLTADAGTPALQFVVDDPLWVVYRGMLKMIQVPHHGSRRNVGPNILDELVGPKLPIDIKNLAAYVSCPRLGRPKHPSALVTNAFRRRGAPVYATMGQNIRHHYDAPTRDDYSSMPPLPFVTEVEVEE